VFNRPLPSSDRRPIFMPQPEDMVRSQLHDFLRYCEQHTGLTFSDQNSFHQFSVAAYERFWFLFLEWSGIVYEGSPEVVCRGEEVETASFFPDVRLSYVENLLETKQALLDELAVVGHHASAPPTRLTRGELRRRVVAVARAYEEMGLAVGDRVVAVSTNTEQLVVAGLAVMAVGAILSTASPDMGPASILARFSQLNPRMLLWGAAVSPATREPASGDNKREIVSGLTSLRWFVALDAPDDAGQSSATSVFLSDLLASGDTDEQDFKWPRFAFNHPLFILFSSGTTGPPKCLIHSSGGVLLEHRKEHALHEDLKEGGTLFFHTSPAWMMWNWQLSALAAGVTIVVYDGPVFDPSTLWSIVDAHEVTAFGTGPSYLRFCERSGFAPRSVYDLSHLRLVMSTGAILSDDQFDWIVDNLGSVRIDSISGGTDIVGCFVLGNPLLPLYRGESQCRSLALDVRSLHPDVASGVGELICANPFPSRPLGLFGDPRGTRFHEAYFTSNAGVWTHGDLIEITERGSARMHGRSDSVLNVGGTRIGPAEIYAVVDAIPGVQESLAVEQAASDHIETSRLVLLVVAATAGPPEAPIDAQIRRALSRAATTAHVPRLVVQVPDLPRTFSGKTSAAAVRDALNGVPVRNLKSLANPESLTTIVAATTRADERRAPTAHDGPARRSVPVGERAVTELCAIFAEHLGLRSVSPDDSFLDLGGTSLQLASVRLAIFDRLGYDVPMSAIFAAPTATSLADYLVHPSEADADTVIRLKTGDPGRRPVFMVHDVTGDVLAYAALAGSLPDSRPIHGVRARGLDGRYQLDSTVDGMADSAVLGIQSIQRSGPYTLVGYSFGGMVAWEMARKLTAAGQQVDHVVLLDSYVGARSLGPLRGGLFVAKRAIHDLSTFRTLGSRDDVPWRSRTATQPTPSPTRLSRPLPPADLVSTPHGNTAQRLAERERVRYTPRPYSGAATFVRADVRLTSPCDPVPVWQRANREHLTVLSTPGDHWSQMTIYVHHLAKTIADLLGLGE
jgi:acetoacetyl-CoA synthetase